MCVVDMVSLILLLFGFTAAADLVFDVPQWPAPNKAALGDNVYLFWSTSGSEITFEVHARAKGYVGIGLSPSGGMAGADIMLGWVKDGKGVLFDLHAEKNGAPIIDTKQNTKLLDSMELNGITMLHFSRRLDTGDCTEDIAITADTLRIIWAYSDSDPTALDTATYHGALRGVTKVQLLDATYLAPSIPADAKTFDIITPNVTVPKSVGTLYWCRGFELQKFTSKQQIVKFAAVIDKTPIVHHIVAVACYGEIKNKSLFNFGYDCFGNTFPKEFRNCTENVFVWAWGGEEDFYFPPDVGISLGQSNDPTVFIVQTHYSNDADKEWVDSSGFRVWYTPASRKNDAGTLIVGSSSSNNLIIPPKTPSFINYAFCGGQCPDEALRSSNGGIHIFAYLLHSHLLGRRIRVRHIRNGTQIGWLGKDEQYDFNYQQSRRFSEEKIVVAGDQIIVECTFDSSDRSNVSFGGESTKEEMCYVFLQYYPRINLAGCGSFVPYQSLNSIVGNISYHENGTISAPQQYAGLQFDDIASRVKWNQTTVQRLERLQLEMTHLMYCIASDGRSPNNSFLPMRYPTFKMLSDTVTCASNRPVIHYFVLFVAAYLFLA